jgi:ubiquinone/menaquinone biosynthesis C-methylase UbiE
MLAHMIGDWDVADLGAGEGWLTVLLAQRARSVTAIDNSPKMVEVGVAHMKENKIRNVEFKLGELEDPPLGKKSMDLIVYSQALHHVEDPEAALRRGVLALRPGGRCVVLDLLKHPHDKARRLYHDRWLGFSESELEDWFKGVGLGEIRIQILEPDPNEPGYTPLLASGRRVA